MNDVGFISTDIATCGNLIPVSENIDKWDHQTVVLLIDGNIEDVMRSIRSRRRPQSLYEGYGYKIHGFVNLN